MNIVGIIYQVENLTEIQNSFMPPNPNLGKEYYVAKDTMKIYERNNGAILETKDFDFLKVSLAPPTTSVAESQQTNVIAEATEDKHTKGADDIVVKKVEFLFSLVNPALIPQELK